MQRSLYAWAERNERGLVGGARQVGAEATGDSLECRQGPSMLAFFPYLPSNRVQPGPAMALSGGGCDALGPAVTFPRPRVKQAQV